MISAQVIRRPATKINKFGAELGKNVASRTIAA